MVISAERTATQTMVLEGYVDHPATLDHSALLQGKVLVEGNYCGHGGGAATAHMYVPLPKAHIWPQLTNYRRWPQYFPNITHSEVLETIKTPAKRYRRLYQVGRKGFLMLTAQVEIYLQVFEVLCERIQFRFEKGTFAHFAADLTLQDMGDGTLLSYSVQAKPLVPVPGFLIEQAMKNDLPGNMEQMRRILCS